MKKFLTTFAVLTAIATPAFAQYAPQDYQTAAPPSVQHKSAARQNGLHAFAMVPRAPAGSRLDDPPPSVQHKSAARQNGAKRPRPPLSVAAAFDPKRHFATVNYCKKYSLQKATTPQECGLCLTPDAVMQRSHTI